MVHVSLFILFDLYICLYIIKKFLKRKTYVPLYWCILLKCSLVRIINLEQLYSLLFMFSISLSSLYCGVSPGLVSWRWRPLHVLRLWYTGSFKKIWTSSTLATEVTGHDTLWFFFFLWGYVKDNAYKPQTARSHSSCGANHWWEQVS